MNKAILLISSVLLAAPAFAGWSGNYRIVEMYGHAGVILVKLSTNPTGTGCADNSYLTFEPSGDTIFKEKYAMLLAAKMAGQAVDIFTSGCGAIQTAHPKVLYVRIAE